MFIIINDLMKHKTIYLRYLLVAWQNFLKAFRSKHESIRSGTDVET